MKFLDRLAALKGWRYNILLLLIGLVGVLGHAPLHIWPVTLIFYGVVFRIITLTDTPRRAFWTGLFIGFGYFMGQMYWIGAAFIARGPEFIPAMPPMIFGLALLLAVFWGMAAWVYGRFRQRSRWPYLTLAALLFVAEFGRGHLFGGLPWNLPGYIFKAGGAMSQSASLFGIYGLSLMSLLIGACIARFLWAGSRLSGLMVIALLCSNFAFGFLRLSQAQVTYVDNVKLRIVAVPFKQKDKMDFDNPRKAFEIVQAHIDLTGAPGLSDVTHVIWPEGAMDGIALANMGLRRALNETFAAADDTPPVWLMNSLRIERDEYNKQHYYNTSVAITYGGAPEGEIQAYNDKTKLVPFGEFIPGGELIEKLGATIISSSLGSITPAKEKHLTEFPGLPIGSSQICYEVIFSGLTPRPKDGKRANWILNQSNDGWYGESVGPYQHANIAKYRAIEEKIPLIRSAANGFSGVVDPYGRFDEFSGPKSLKAIDARLPQSIGESLPITHINLLLLLICVVLVIIPPAGRRSDLI